MEKKIDLPPTPEMLARDLERSKYVCKCENNWGIKRGMFIQPRTHDGDCLHSTAMRLHKPKGKNSRSRSRSGGGALQS